MTESPPLAPDRPACEPAPSAGAAPDGVTAPDGLDTESGAGDAPADEATADQDPGDDRHTPMRRCIVTGEVQTKERMLRFVVAPDGRVVFDLAGRLPGRGMWVSCDRVALERAIVKKAFARAARRSVMVSSTLVQDVADSLERRLADLIGLSRRAGQVVAGFEQVREALSHNRINRSQPVRLLLEARDGASEGRQKLRALAPGIPVIQHLDADALGAALGRDRIVHAAVASGGLAEQLIAEAARLSGVAAVCLSEDEHPPRRL